MPSRSHPGVKKPRKKKKKATVALHDLLRDKVKKTPREDRIGGHIDVSDSDEDKVDDGGGDDHDDDANETFSSEELISSVGPHQSLRAWAVLPPPAETNPEWLVILRERHFTWVRRRLAHVFESGWADGTCRGAVSSAYLPGEDVSVGDSDSLCYVFYYKDTKNSLVHGVHLDEYGMTKAWVIVEKLPAAKDLDDDSDVRAPSAPETRLLAVGDVGDALWKGCKDFYKATIESSNPDGTFGVRNHDGDIHKDLPSEFIKLATARTDEPTTAGGRVRSKKMANHQHPQQP